MTALLPEHQETNNNDTHNDHPPQQESVVERMVTVEVSVSDDTSEIAVEPSLTPSSSLDSSSSTFWMVYAIAIFAFLGAVARAYLAQYLQCHDSSSTSSQPQPQPPPSSTLCVTSIQSALFVDLPANWLGSFFLGLLLHPHFNHSPFPFCKAWQVGFCGSLTTFSAWNMQMVILLEQGDIGTALLGYMVGTLGAYGSFCVGMAVSTLLLLRMTRKSRSDEPGDGTEEPSQTHRATTLSVTTPGTRKPNYPPEVWLIPPTLLTCGLVLFFLIGPSSEDSTSLAPLIWTAPAGALTRYYLSIRCNTISTPMRGTLIANWTACTILAVVMGLNIRNTTATFPWTSGFLGSLSTVSTWIKEIHFHASPSNWIYAAVTLGGAMLLSLVIYLPLHRFV